MNGFKKVHFLILFFPILIVAFLLLITLLMVNSSSGNPSIMVIVNGFSVPFENDIEYKVTSDFGDRVNPITGNKELHDGIDLAVAEGTNIVASLSGVVIETGYQENGLGNYVYIEHQLNGMIFYTAYGHMANDSIVVNEGQMVSAKEKIGVVGRSGMATGTHLHFSIMSPKLKFDVQNLIDPRPIFEYDMRQKLIS